MSISTQQQFERIGLARGAVCDAPHHHLCHHRPAEASGRPRILRPSRYLPQFDSIPVSLTTSPPPIQAVDEHSVASFPKQSLGCPLGARGRFHDGTAPKGRLGHQLAYLRRGMSSHRFNLASVALPARTSRCRMEEEVPLAALRAQHARFATPFPTHTHARSAAPVRRMTCGMCGA